MKKLAKIVAFLVGLPFVMQIFFVSPVLASTVTTGLAHLDENHTLYDLEIPATVMLNYNNLSDLTSVSTALSNLGLGGLGATLAAKFDTPTGTTSQYVRGDGSLATLPSSSQVNSDWNAVSGVAEILNKPSLFSGAYADLTGKPTIPAAQVNSDWNASTGFAQILNKPSLATVATTGAYSDLSGKPTIPSAQIQSDWTQTNTSALDYIKNKPSTVSRSFNNTPSHSIVTTAAAANGFQLSTTRDAQIGYSSSITTSVSLSGNSSGYVVLEIAPTNSTTASDWIEIDRTPSGQSGSLVVGLVLNQTGGGHVGGIVPAGYYARLRSVNVNGTPTYTYTSGQEVLL